MGRNGRKFFCSFLDKKAEVKKSEDHLFLIVHFQGSQYSEVGFVGLFLLPPELFLLGLEFVVLEVILARQVVGRIRLHLVVVPGERAEPVGAVSLVEHLHGRPSDDGVDVPSPVIQVALLFPIIVQNRRYGYRLLLLEESQDGLNGSITHSKLLSKEGDLYRAFAPMHADIVLDDGETFIGSGLSHFPERHSAFLPSSDIHEAVVVLRFVVVSDYGWVFLSHFPPTISNT